MLRRWTHAGWLVVALAALVTIVWVVVSANGPVAPSPALQPSALTLQQGEVGSGYRLMVNGPTGPTQRALKPPPYQNQFEGGSLKYYVSTNVLEPASLDEIDTWASAHGVPVTSPPTIVGPYVVDHHGVFAITSVALVYADVQSAIADFHCCTYLDREASFANYQVLTVHIGDEATAFGGITQTPAHDPQYEVQIYAIRWRHGSVVFNMSILGSHDISLQDALRLAQIQDGNVTQG